MWLRVCSNDHAPLTVMPYIFFFKIKNCLNDDLFISCEDRIGKMLHNICISAVAMSLRWVTRGPWASCFFAIVKRTRKNKINHRTPIFVFTYYFGHLSYYLCIFLLCCRSIYTWYRLKYTKFRNGSFVGGFAISSGGYFSNGSASLNKMAALPIYGKKSSSPVLRKLSGWILVNGIGDLERSTKFVKMMRLGWPLIFLWYGQICIPVAVAILEDCCMAFANMQVSKLWSMGLLF